MVEVSLIAAMISEEEKLEDHEREPKIITPYRVRALLAAVIFAILTIAPLGTAQAGMAESIKSIGEKLKKLDPDNQIPKTINGLVEANCAIDKALGKMFGTDSEVFDNILRKAGYSYGGSADVIETLVKQGRFQETIPDSLKSVFHLSGLFSVIPKTMADLLRRIAFLARKAEAAAKRIADGSGGQSDLMSMVQTSTDITRLIAMFILSVVEI